MIGDQPAIPTALREGMSNEERLAANTHRAERIAELIERHRSALAGKIVIDLSTRSL